jgi:hypothetical protein
VTTTVENLFVESPAHRAQLFGALRRATETIGGEPPGHAHGGAGRFILAYAPEAVAPLPAPPTETSSFFIDALVLELMEPEVEAPFSLPAIAAAARECWQSLASPPAISTFLASVRKHQARLDVVFQQLCDIVDAALWAEDQIKPDKPESSGTIDDDDSDIPF